MESELWPLSWCNPKQCHNGIRVLMSFHLPFNGSLDLSILWGRISINRSLPLKCMVNKQNVQVIYLREFDLYFTNLDFPEHVWVKLPNFRIFWVLHIPKSWNLNYLHQASVLLMPAADKALLQGCWRRVMAKWKPLTFRTQSLDSARAA